MPAKSEPASTVQERTLVITRLLNAPPELVFKAWTEPKHLVNWWGPSGFTTPTYRMDVRPGGSYRICIRSAEGVEYWMQGDYQEVVPPSRLVFTFAWDTADGSLGPETLVTVTFDNENGKTRFTFHQAVFDTLSACNDHRDGWTECFNDLETYLAEMNVSA